MRGKLIIPTFADPFSLARQQRDEDRAWAQNAYVDRKTKAAEAGEQPPAMLPSDASEEDVATSMSWDFSPGWEQRREKEIRAMRSSRRRFLPAARRPIPGGGFENIYPYGDFDLEPFRQGLCCVRCQNWKHDDPIQHAREHADLRAQLVGEIEPPAGVPLKDMCAFCGNRLDLQNYRDEQAA